MLLFPSNVVSEVSEEHMMSRWGKLLAKVLQHITVWCVEEVGHHTSGCFLLHSVMNRATLEHLTEQEHLSPEER